MAKKHLLLIIILSLLSATGCWDLREINTSAIPITMGIELSPTQKITFSTLFEQPVKPAEATNSQIKTIVVTASDDSVAMAARRQMLSLSRVSDWEHVQTIVLGDNLVRNDLLRAMDFINRNRNIRPDIPLFVMSGSSPEELLAEMSKLGDGLKQLIVVNELQLGIYVPATTGEFIYKLMTPGIEATVPQLIIKEVPGNAETGGGGDKNTPAADTMKKVIALQGTAVFKGSKMTGYLDETESRGYRWLNSEIKTGGFLLVKSPLNPQDYVVLEVVRFSSKTRPRLCGNNLKMQLDINAQVDFYEATGPGELLTPAMIKKVEAAANVEIARQIRRCIHKSQNLNSDILGWGLILHEYQPDKWKQLQPVWNELYPFIEADVSVKTVINQTYLSHKSLKFR